MLVGAIGYFVLCVVMLGVGIGMIASVAASPLGVSLVSIAMTGITALLAVLVNLTAKLMA